MAAMDAFNVGMQMGTARSPYSGMNSMIKQVLDQAMKVGLIRSQAASQYDNAFRLAERKSELQQNAWKDFPGYNPYSPATVNVGGKDVPLYPKEVGGKVILYPASTGSPLDWMTAMFQNGGGMPVQPNGTPNPADEEPLFSIQ